jgi:hypothetical protein
MKLTIKTAADLAAEALALHVAAVTRAIDAHVEAPATAMGYNSAAHLASYTGSTVPAWSAEAQAFVAWRDAVWLAAFGVQQAAQANGVLPDAADVIAALPAFAPQGGEGHHEP